MNAAFAEALCSDPGSVILAETVENGTSSRLTRLQLRLADLSADQFTAIEGIVDAILTPKKQQEATDG